VGISAQNDNFDHSQNSCVNHTHLSSKPTVTTQYIYGCGVPFIVSKENTYKQH